MKKILLFTTLIAVTLLFVSCAGYPSVSDMGIYNKQLEAYNQGSNDIEKSFIRGDRDGNFKGIQRREYDISSAAFHESVIETVYLELDKKNEPLVSKVNERGSSTVYPKGLLQDLIVKPSPDVTTQYIVVYKSLFKLINKRLIIFVRPLGDPNTGKVEIGVFVDKGLKDVTVDGTFQFIEDTIASM